MLSSAFMSFKANATEYRDCPPDVCEGMYCNKCVYNENNQVIAAGYMDVGRFVPSEYRKYDDGKLVESYTYNNYDDPIVIAAQYIYNDAGQLVQKTRKYDYYEDDFGAFNVSDYTYSDFNGYDRGTNSYNYDNAGHLTEVYSNGQLVAKYSYEDGHLAAKFESTPNPYNDYQDEKLIRYDSEGNIIFQGEFFRTSCSECNYGEDEDYYLTNERFGPHFKTNLGNGSYYICDLRENSIGGAEDCEAYYIEDENGNYSECSSFVNALLGITIEDEQRANAPQSQRFELSDGSTKIIDADGKVHYEGKRIYTVDEANQVAGKVNRVSIRYR